MSSNRKLKKPHRGINPIMLGMALCIGPVVNCIHPLIAEECTPHWARIIFTVIMFATIGAFMRLFWMAHQIAEASHERDVARYVAQEEAASQAMLVLANREAEAVERRHQEWMSVNTRAQALANDRRHQRTLKVVKAIGKARHYQAELKRFSEMPGGLSPDVVRKGFLDA